MDPLTVKCPTCSRHKGEQCIKLLRPLGAPVTWVNSAPHPARMGKTRD